VRQGARWLAALRAELLSFPAGLHDDQVDALSLIGQLLARVGAGPKLKPSEPPRRDDYRPAFDMWSPDRNRKAAVHGLKKVLGSSTVKSNSSVLLFEQFPPLHDMQLLRVRRPVIVEENLVVQPNGVDHQRVALLVMANRLPVPRRLGIGRMGHIHIDTPDMSCASPSKIIVTCLGVARNK
jgi:hypothetical protein